MRQPYPSSRQALADFDGDGVVDLARAPTIDTVLVALGRGDGTFGPARFFSKRERGNTLLVAVELGPGPRATLVAPREYGSTIAIFRPA